MTHGLFRDNRGEMTDAGVIMFIPMVISFAVSIVFVFYMFGCSLVRHESYQATRNNAAKAVISADANAKSIALLQNQLTPPYLQYLAIQAIQNSSNKVIYLPATLSPIGVLDVTGGGLSTK